MEFAACAPFSLPQQPRNPDVLPEQARLVPLVHRAVRSLQMKRKRLDIKPQGRLAGSPRAAAAEPATVPRAWAGATAGSSNSATEVVAGSAIATARQSGILPAIGRPSHASVCLGKYGRHEEIRSRRG